MVTVSERKPSGLRIGDWIADPATNELRRGGQVVRIEPKPMDLLMRLAERPGEVVAREELLAKVWPGVVVADEALTQGMARLRRALGEDPRSPVYIETIAKRGYRLAANVGPVEAAASAPRVAPRRGLVGAGAIAVVLILAFAGYYLATDRAPAEEPFTVTVSPFESLSADPGQAYFARGMGDALVTELGRLSGLRVTTAGGRYVVSGSVQRDASALRMNVRLVDARSGEVLWSERFDRPYEDLFRTQDEVIRRVAETVPARMSKAERAQLAKRHTRSLEAYDRFLQARALFLVRQPDDNLRARELYGQAIRIDPRFARAYAGLAMTHAIESRLHAGRDAEAANRRATELAETAVQIDPDVAEVRWSLGFVHVQAKRHDKAIAELQRAVELNPSFADAYALLGGVNTYIGQPGKSIPLLRTAMRLDPVGGYLYYLLLGRAYLFQGDNEQALINLREAAARNPADLETRLFLAATLVASGNRAGAQWEAEEVRALQRDFSLAAWLEGYPLTSAPHRERLARLLSDALRPAPS
jgi:DNA-binding winged helix-turn-helix (wHTH) protein/TolB-like protein/Tfp pilus assembly protein PilF